MTQLTHALHKMGLKNVRSDEGQIGQTIFRLQTIDKTINGAKSILVDRQRDLLNKFMTRSDTFG